MKIRTSFVTNSSGSSSSRVMIENEVLYDLLKKYTDDINNRLKEIDNSSICIANLSNEIISDGSEYGDGPSKEQFWYYSDNSSIKKIPSAYINCLDSAIRDYKYDEIINNIFNELKKELDEKENLINKMYSKFEMYSDCSHDEGSNSSKTIIDKENKCPKCGDTLVYRYNSFWNWKTSGNEESLTCKNPKCTYNIKITNSDKSIEIPYDDDLPFETNNYFDESELNEITDDDLPF